MEGGEAEFRGDANIQTTAENKTRELPEPHATPLLQTRPRSTGSMGLRGEHSGLHHLTAMQRVHRNTHGLRVGTCCVVHIPS